MSCPSHSISSLTYAALFQGPLRPVRITLLDLSIGDYEIAELFAVPDDALPHVQEIRLDMDIRVNSLPLRIPSFIRHTRYIRFCGQGRGVIRPDGNALHRIAFPWGQMRHLNCQAQMTTTNCLNLLDQMTLLEECCLCVVNEHRDNLVLRRKEVKLSKLQVFHINCCYGDSGALTTIIKSISAPGMKNLKIRGSLNLGEEITTVLKTRFNLNLLDEIDLCDLRGNIPINTLLREATSMRRVVLTSGKTRERPVLSGLAEGHFGPCLDSIEIPRYCKVQEILDMVEARRRISETSDNHGDQKITPFKYVRFWSQENRENFAEKIEAFKTLGVEIVINGHPADPGRKPERWSELVQPRHIHP
ncbi:hypothetical protein AX17_005400 [Amanita inopinata Kibby_2008]|nr:hypothetical protein AX17_005400 [Amanita inopinata Kibby_2008]